MRMYQHFIWAQTRYHVHNTLFRALLITITSTHICNADYYASCCTTFVAIAVLHYCKARFVQYSTQYVKVKQIVMTLMFHNGCK